MEQMTAKRVYNTLQNLRHMELSYMEYSEKPRDFSEYQTFTDYFNSRTLREKELHRFYFPIDLHTRKLPKYISDLGDVTDLLNIMAGCEFSVCKLFNFPDALRHKCNYYTMIYLMEGGAQLLLDVGSFALSAGDIYFIPPEIYYTIQADQEALCLCFNLRRSFVAAEYPSIALGHPQLTKFFTESLAADASAQYAAIHTGALEDVKALALHVFAEYLNQDDYSSVTMRSTLSLLFAAVLRDSGTRVESSAKLTRMDEQFHQIESYIKKNYQTANLTELADTIHFSKQYICRIVKEKTGDTFNTLLIRTKLQMVVQYLLETELPLEEIAYLCGFSAASHMSRTFKNEYGITPSAYRSEKKTLPTP